MVTRRFAPAGTFDACSILHRPFGSSSSTPSMAHTPTLSSFYTIESTPDAARCNSRESDVEVGSA